MFRKLGNIFRYMKLEKEKSKNKKIDISLNIDTKIPKDINNIEIELKKIFVDSFDFILRKITIGDDFKREVIITYIDGMINEEIINNDVLERFLEFDYNKDNDEWTREEDIIQFIKKEIITASDIREVKDFKKTIESILSGDTLMYVNGADSALVISARDWKERSISEPVTESVIRGPREGFVENLKTNTAMLRRKIKNPKLKFETLTLGVETDTDICICYIKGIADENIISDLKYRLSCIKSDSILESGYIEQFIEDAPFSPFQTIGVSERPDKVAGKLLEGRIAIICDGTPFVLTLPYLFVETLQSSEDYYSRILYASFNRMLRFISFIITTMLPALYIALINFHTKVIPVRLLLSIMDSHEGIPFDPFWEAIFMSLLFELLREAGIRMPQPIGQAISIVGALVIGESVVAAGLASEIMIIIIALTAITSFIVPALSESLPFIRIILMIGANILGFMGIVIMLAIIMLHLSSLRSFGVPYLSPFSPFRKERIEDTLIRAPLWSMFKSSKLSSWKYSNNYSDDKNYIEKED
ncbi:spore germination protein [Clostridium sp. D2Q-14]|uniref:spore germination protein n=1 Tax=Anaeromonas gelatinilytica TaxID=2683194 RepID=UPI00193BC749|nr:spore germination protein [Anaeromonas gelatinilytica]MBS4534759.1 spore germination protein [Anaeromonas gelatinilytica]